MSAAAAQLELRLQLVELVDSGRSTPCLVDPAPFTSDDRAERREAAAACSPCPVLVECARAALAGDEPAGVWGGVDLTPCSGVSPRAVHAELAERGAL